MNFCSSGNVVILSRVIFLLESLEVSELSVGRLTRFLVSG